MLPARFHAFTLTAVRSRIFSTVEAGNLSQRVNVKHPFSYVNFQAVRLSPGLPPIPRRLSHPLTFTAAGSSITEGATLSNIFPIDRAYILISHGLVPHSLP